MEKQEKPKKNNQTPVYTTEAVKKELTEYAQACGISFSQLCISGARLYMQQNPLAK